MLFVVETWLGETRRGGEKRTFQETERNGCGNRGGGGGSTRTTCTCCASVQSTQERKDELTSCRVDRTSMMYRNERTSGRVDRTSMRRSEGRREIYSEDRFTDGTQRT